MQISAMCYWLEQLAISEKHPPNIPRVIHPYFPLAEPNQQVGQIGTSGYMMLQMARTMLAPLV
jgi:hypothetical protein